MIDQGAAGSAAWEGFDLDEAALCARTWRLSDLGDGHALAQHLVFQPGGDLTGWFSESERSWRIEGRRLVLFDRYDRRTVSFDRLRSVEGGRLELSGAGVDAEGAPLGRVLSERDPRAGLRPDPPVITLVSRPGVERRRNLVVLRANEQSLHPGWARDIEEADRSWDLLVSFYGDPANFGADPFAEHQVLQQANRKYEAIFDLFWADSPLWAYDFVAFPDDDMRTSWRDLNELFAICRRYRLQLAQPALTGYVTHSIARPQPEWFLRYTSFVEPIAPVFSRDALRLCAPSFPGTRSAYGLDHVWPKLLGEPRDRMAIIDQVSFEHTRPVAASYDMGAALAEGWAFQMAHDAFPRELEYGGIRRVPVDRYLTW